MFTTICFILAVLCFLVAAAGVDVIRVNLIALGLFFLTLALWAPIA